METIRKDLMQDRTVNIILISKRFGSFDHVKKAIAQYMSEECCCPVEVYTDRILFSIVENAMFDFLHHASRKCDCIAFIREIVESDYEKMLDRLLWAMCAMQVAENVNGEYKYINGWHDTDFTKKLDADKWTMKWNK